MRGTVLVIDDAPDLRDMLRMLLLHEEGDMIIETADPASALDILHSTPHSLVVRFNYRMLPSDGEALLTLAEQEAQLVERHAFVCTTDISRDHLPLTLIALPTGYKVPLVPKPFEVDDLLAVTEQAEQRFAQRLTHLRLTLKLKW